MKPNTTPKICTKKWNEALATIFKDLIERLEPRERRIILEGLSGIYVRFEETTEHENSTFHTFATGQQICNVVNLKTYRPREKDRKAPCSE